MNNNILKIQNDFFFFPKKNVPKNRHEKRRELPDYYLNNFQCNLYAFESVGKVSSYLIDLFL